MSKYIDREQACEALCAECKECFPECQYNWDCPFQRALIHSPSADVVPIGEEWERGYTAGQMAERREHEWIPCEERLPEPYSGTYLCCGKDGTLMMLNYDSLGNGDYTVAFYYTDDDGYAVTPNVIAWMPLPPAYQPKERSE